MKRKSIVFTGFRLFISVQKFYDGLSTERKASDMGMQLKKICSSSHK